MDPLPGDALADPRNLVRAEPPGPGCPAGRVGHRRYRIGAGATPDTTSYRCASITKTMTATLVMQQVEAGRLRLDESIATYLGWTRRLPHAKDISIRHLLVHGSGVIRDGSNRWSDDDFPDRETVRREVRQQLSFAEPATTFRYSNIAYVLLGEVLEAVTGRTFEALLQRDVLGPLGLKGSAASCSRVSAKRLPPATSIDVPVRSCAPRGIAKLGLSDRREASSPLCRICSCISRHISRAPDHLSPTCRDERCSGCSGCGTRSRTTGSAG